MHCPHLHFRLHLYSIYLYTYTRVRRRGIELTARTALSYLLRRDSAQPPRRSGYRFLSACRFEFHKRDKTPSKQRAWGEITTRLSNDWREAICTLKASASGLYGVSFSRILSRPTILLIRRDVERSGWSVWKYLCTMVSGCRFDGGLWSVAYGGLFNLMGERLGWVIG